MQKWLSDDIREIVFSLSIFNRVKVFDKVSLSVGFGGSPNPC